MIAGNEANRVLRLETECDLLADFEVGEAAGLRQGDPDVDAPTRGMPSATGFINSE